MDITNESIIELANYFGEDPTVACEGVKEFMGKAKERVKSLCKKIREFIARIAAWIRGKFASFLKHDTYRIDKELWKNANSALMEDSKALSHAQDLLKRIKPYLAIQTNSDADNAKTTEMLNNMESKIHKSAEDYNRVIASNAHKMIEDFTMASADKTKFTVISAKPLNTHKNNMIQLLDTTNKEIAELEKLNNENKLNSNVFGLFNIMMKMVIEVINYIVSTINKVIACSVSKPEKEVKEAK